MLHIGIIGAGWYGESHAKAIADIADAQVTAACRTNKTELDSFVQQYGGKDCKGYTDYRDLLADPNVDVVVIATPHHLHTNVVEDAAAAHKHILLEKPMAPTLEECDRILKAAQQHSVKLMLGHTNHFAPAYIKAKELIDSGEMGEVVLGLSTMSKFWFEPNRRSWHLDRALGGGVWLTVGVHPLDRLMWLVGSPVKTVSGQFGTRFHDQKSDDVGMVFLRFANNAAATIVSTGYAVGAPKHSTELTCTKGMLNIDYRQGVFIGRSDKWQLVPDTAYEDWAHRALVGEWQGFLHAIQVNCDPPVTGAFGREVMRVAFAAEESSRLGQEVSLRD